MKATHTLYFRSDNESAFFFVHPLSAKYDDPFSDPADHQSTALQESEELQNAEENFDQNIQMAPKKQPTGSRAGSGGNFNILDSRSQFLLALATSDPSAAFSLPLRLSFDISNLHWVLLYISIVAHVGTEAALWVLKIWDTRYDTKEYCFHNRDLVSRTYETLSLSHYAAIVGLAVLITYNSIRVCMFSARSLWRIVFFYICTNTALSLLCSAVFVMGLILLFSASSQGIPVFLLSGAIGMGFTPLLLPLFDIFSLKVRGHYSAIVVVFWLLTLIRFYLISLMSQHECDRVTPHGSVMNLLPTVMQSLLGSTVLAILPLLRKKLMLKKPMVNLNACVLFKDTHKHQ